MKPIALLILLFPLLLLSQDWTTGEGWKKKEVIDSIYIFTRTEAQMALYEVKSVLTLTHSPEMYLNRFVLLHTDPRVEARLNGRQAERQSELLEQGTNFKYIYRKLPMPFPLKDRDVVLKQEVAPMPNGFVVKTFSTPEYKPEVKSYMRIQQMTGIWVVKMEVGHLQIAFKFHVDPGGDVPESMVRNNMSRTALSSMTRMLEILNDASLFQGIE